LYDYIFAEVSDVSGLGSFYESDYFDGVCGLAFEAKAVDGTKTFLSALADQLDHNVFSIWLGDDPTGNRCGG